MHQKTILSSNQTHPLHHTFFVPKKTIKASLLIIHGMSEHSGRYANFAQFLADNGILVLTFDLLGHGKTAKNRDELGFFDSNHPVQTLCKDVIIMTNALKDKARQLSDSAIPCFVMGHSMGSFLLRTVLCHHATSFNGIILMGTGNGLGKWLPFSRYPATILRHYRASRRNERLAKVFNHLLCLKGRCLFDPSPFAWVTYNTDNLTAFSHDPLVGFAFTNNGFYTLHQLVYKACRSAWYEHLSSDTPILLISGKDDPVGNMGQDILALQETLMQANKSVRSILYPNMRHEPLHENDYLTVYHDILYWLNNALDSPAIKPA